MVSAVIGGCSTRHRGHDCARAHIPAADDGKVMMVYFVHDWLLVCHIPYVQIRERPCKDMQYAWHLNVIFTLS